MKIIKKNIKLLIFIIIGILISGSAVIAESIIEANHVKYSNSKTEKTNVQDAIDELYEISKTLKYNYIGSTKAPATFPNKDEGYIVENINCNGASAVWDNTNWSINFKNITSDNFRCNITLNDDVKEVYGETIQTLYKNIYTSNNTTVPLTASASFDNYYSGNFAAPTTLLNLVGSNSNLISSTPHALLTEYSIISSGNNTYNLVETINKWVVFSIFGAYGSGNYTISSFKLTFKDGSSLTIQEAINNKYIEPLSILSSSAQEQKYLSQNFYNIINGGNFDGYFSIGYIIIKITNKSPLVGCSLTSNINFNTTNDGLIVHQLSENFKISTKPLK